MSEHVLDEPDGSITARLLCSGVATEVATNDGKVLLRLYGELDMATAPGIGQRRRAAFDSKPAAISVDLSKVTFVDSTGLGVFVSGSVGPQAPGAPSPFAHRAAPC